MATNPQRARKPRSSEKQTVEDLRQATGEAQKEFVMTELETSITFCKVALSTDDEARKSRNTQNALQGYQNALRFSHSPASNLQTNEKFQQGLAKLKECLHQLGSDI